MITLLMTYNKTPFIFFFLEYLVDSTDVSAIEARLRQHLHAHPGLAEATAAIARALHPDAF